MIICLFRERIKDERKKAKQQSSNKRANNYRINENSERDAIETNFKLSHIFSSASVRFVLVSGLRGCASAFSSCGRRAAVRPEYDLIAARCEPIDRRSVAVYTERNPNRKHVRTELPVARRGTMWPEHVSSCAVNRRVDHLERRTAEKKVDTFRLLQLHQKLEFVYNNVINVI